MVLKVYNVLTMEKTVSGLEKIRKKLAPISLAAVIILSAFSLVFTPFLADTARAATPDDILNRARAWSALNALIDEAGNMDTYTKDVSNAQIDSCDILSGSTGNLYVGSAVTGNNDNGGAAWNSVVDNSSILKGALSSVGIQNGCRGILTALGYQITTSGMSKPDGLNQGLVRSKLQAALAPNAFFGAALGNDSPGDALAYALLIYNLKNVCGWAFRNPYVANDGANTTEGARNREAQTNGATGDSRGQHYHTYTFENGGAGDNTYYKDQGREDDVRVGSHSGFASSVNDSEVDCGDNNAGTFGAILADNHKFADAYAKLVGTDGTSDAGAGTAADGKNSASVVTCAIDAIGWIVCPIMQVMSKMVDGAYAVVAGMLTVQPLVSGTASPIYQAWSVMRNFANVAFVIAFLVIVFSQLTNVGITNYGIKKMLPRLVVAAILVNASFWVCAIAVDISNILGSSLNGLFQNIAQSSITLDGTATQTGLTGWQDITGKIIAGTLLTGAAIYIGLSALVPAVTAGLIIIVTVFITLVIRQALIILLIVLSPLAFVAYLLPNTESLFRRWREMFQTLLILYPIISLIFGASALASKILMASAGG